LACECLVGVEGQCAKEWVARLASRAHETRGQGCGKKESTHEQASKRSYLETLAEIHGDAPHVDEAACECEVDVPEDKREKGDVHDLAAKHRAQVEEKAQHCVVHTRTQRR
jgi:hypothetical protein